MFAASHTTSIERAPSLLGAVRLPISPMRLLDRREQLNVFLLSCTRLAT
jgi:hypothetical protein